GSASIDTVNRRHDLASERLTRNAENSSTARSTGDHQPNSPLVRGIGNRPRRYPASTVPGARSAPVPTRSSSGHEWAGGNQNRVASGTIAVTTANLPLKPR